MMRPVSVDLKPPRRFHRMPLVWLGWATASCALLGVSAWSLSQHITITPTQRYSGTFVSQARTLPVVLPAGAVLQSVLAQDGDDVSKGQKLARYDRDAMVQHSIELSNQLALNRQHRWCLLQENTGTPASEAPANSTDALSAEADLPLDLRKESNLARCHNTHRLNRLTRDKLQQRRDSLRRKSALAVQELLARAALAKPSAQSVLKLRAAIEKEALEASIRELEFDLALLQETQRKTVLNEVQRLEQDALTIEAELTALSALIDAPWLISPGTGQLLRLRQLSPETASDTALTLAQIHQPQNKVFHAAITLPEEQAAQLKAGDHLPVRLLDMGKLQAQISGQIKQITPAKDAATLAQVELELRPQETDHLLQSTLEDLPAGTHAAIEVTVPERSFTDILSGSAKTILQSF